MSDKIKVSTPEQRAAEKSADTSTVYIVDRVESIGYRVDLGLHEEPDARWQAKQEELKKIVPNLEITPPRESSTGFSPTWRATVRKPVRGDRVRMFGGLGFQIHGLDIEIDGEWVEVYYDTKEERDLAHEQWKANYKLRQMQDYERERPKLDELYNELPLPLKKRIDRFRAEDPKFRWESESYEMASCSEAGRLYKRAIDPEFGKALKAERVKAPKPGLNKSSIDLEEEDGTLDWEDTPLNRLAAFDAINSKLNGYNYTLMETIMPEMDDGHSGNTWGFAIALARELIKHGDKADL